MKIAGDVGSRLGTEDPEEREEQLTRVRGWALGNKETAGFSLLNLEISKRMMQTERWLVKNRSMMRKTLRIVCGLLEGQKPISRAWL